VTDELSPPVVLWDGECGFCRRWIDHWKDRVPDEVGFVPFQDVAGARLHEWGIDEVDLEEAMHFVDANGRTFRGAEAVFELLRGAEDLRYRVAAALYRHVEAFRLLADAAYRFVANRRVLAARVTRALWGQPQRSTYQFARWLFIRLLAVSAFVAFWSMWQQIDGLLGSNGILPAAEYMDRATAYADQHALTTWERYEELPTLFWRSTSDAFLRGVCVSGMIGSGILFVGFVPRLVIPLLWFLYLSIMSVGQVFLGYQWDALLLEALLVGWFVAPWNPFPRVERPHRVSIAGRTLVWLLLFKLMFLSGWVKIRADEAWRSLQAMDYHFWTQPIPNAVAWYADRAPELVKSAAVAFTLFAELLVPFLIFAPRRFRHTGALTVIALQLGIGLTGTYGFFNILTIALCVLLFDDGFVEWATRGRFTVTGVASGNRWRLAAQTASVLVVGALVLLPMLGSLGFAKARVPDSLRSFRTFNSYGLFARMTRERPEIGVEVSRDGTTWTPLDFRWKPTRVDEPLRPTTFHMPRLDWQMWFAALGNCRQNVWFHAFLQRLMQGSAPVGRLLEDYDADRTPPAFVRTPFYRYEFGEGRWWTRRRTGTYCPTLTLNGDGNLAVAE
jgi:predicted DCC family thiol-disulfide oxidoreductase YuxK